MLSVSIVIYQLDSSLLARLLESLYIASTTLPEEYLPITIIIIDNGNNVNEIKTSLEKHNKDCFRFSIISTLKNLGYGKAHNIGIKFVNSKYHLILNPDVILDVKSLQEGIRFMDLNSNACCLTPNSTDQYGGKQYLAKQYPAVLDLFLRGLMPNFIQNIFKTRLNNYELKEITTSEEPVKVKMASGCYMFCRTDILKIIHGFDERYFLYFEDFALSLEIAEHGDLIYLPSMKIQHYGGEASKKGLIHIWMFIISGIQFFNKYGWKII